MAKSASQTAPQAIIKSKSPQKPTSQVFQFKKFEVNQADAAMKIGTDSVLLGAWAPVAGVRKVLDIGCGTGILAMMIAQRAENEPFSLEKNAENESVGFVDAVELDEKSAATASLNFSKTIWAAQLRCHAMRIQDFARESNEKYDLIISNPPFFSGGTFSADENRASVRHNFQLPNGDLLQVARQLLAENGRFCVILPHLEGLRFAEMAAVYGLSCTQKVDVFGRREKPAERVLLQFEKNPFPFVRSEFTINGVGQAYSDEFLTLTAAFYL
jgi:tRNA1Val (adenine37-N6)-methyltransferase